MVMKLVIVVFALLLLVWLVLGSSRRRAQDARRKDAVRSAPPTAPPAAQVEGMVACARCGVHLPASLALLRQGRNYCSAAHRDGGPGAS